MVSRDPAGLTEIVLSSLERTGQRGIILGGWAGLAEQALPSSVIRLDSVPHSWLFPRVSAVVHHGGVGTTHEGLRAGRPSVLVPFFGDQPFWADRVHELGAGTMGIPQAELSIERLSAAIEQAITDKAMAQQANEIARQMRLEDGVGTAVNLVEAYTAQRPTFDWRAG
jgi:sterol 3beta-glucosyltransferase